MAVHYFEESPSPPQEQRERLFSARAITHAGIPCVVWAEDALSIVHRVPTGLFDLQLLVPDVSVTAAAQEVLRKLPYEIIAGETDKRWKDYRIWNEKQPYAFPKSILLRQTSPFLPNSEYEAERIVIHPASTFHFSIADLSRTCTNSPPLDNSYAAIRFPTAAAFLDAIVDTLHAPPLPCIHKKLFDQLRNFQAYLFQYTLSDKGITVTESGQLIPSCARVLEDLKEENRPLISRFFKRDHTLSQQEATDERIEIMKRKCLRLGIPFVPPRIPYSPYVIHSSRVRSQISAARVSANASRVLSTLARNLWK